MKPFWFSDAQMAFILEQGEEGVAVAEICRKAGISQGRTFLSTCGPMPTTSHWSSRGLASPPTTRSSRR